MNLLIVDDTVHTQLKAALEEKGYRVKTARTEEEALTVLQNNHIDGIVSAVFLPGMDGFSLCRTVKSDNTLKEIPFIFVTDTSDEEDESSAVILGADLFIKTDEPVTVIQYIEKGLHNPKLFENTHDTVSLLDSKEVHLKVNKKTSDLLGYTEEELKTLSFKDIVVPSAVPDADKLEKLLEGDIPVYKTQFRAKDGKVIPVKISVSKIRDDTGNITYIQRIEQDIRERKEVEKPLRESEKIYRILFEKSPVSITLLDKSGVIIDTNTSTEELTGYTREQLVGKSFDQLLTLDSRDMPHLKEKYEKLSKGQEVEPYELEIIRKDGKRRHINVINSLLVEGDEVYGFLIISNDITERKKAEEAYQTLVEYSLQGLAIIQDFQVVFANPALAAMLGYSVEELTSFSPEELQTLVHPEDWAVNLGQHRERLKGEFALPHYELRVTGKDGVMRWLEAYASRVEYRGKPAVQVTVIDITEKKNAEKALKSERDKLKALFEGLDRTGIGIDIVGSDYRILYQNTVLKEQFGDSTGNTCYKVYMGSEKPCTVCPVRNAITHNRVESAEQVNIRKRHIGLISAPLPNPDGTVDKAIEVIIDNTERVKAEKALQESEEQYRALFEGSRDAIAINARDGTFIDVNQSALDLFGYTEGELIGMNAQDLYVDPDDRRAFQQEIEYTGFVKDYAVKMVKKDGTEMDCLVTSTVWRANDGSILGYQGVIRDVTVHKKMEEALLKSEEKYRTLVELAPDGVVTLDVTGVVTSCNTATARLTGYSKDDIVGSHFTTLKFLQEKYLSQYQTVFNQLIEGKTPQPFEITWVHKDGTPYLGEAHIRLMKKGNQISGIQVFVRDMTERKWAEMELRESEEKFRNLAEQSPNMIFINKKGKIVYVNEKCEEVMGFKKQEFYSNDFDFLTLIGVKSRKKVKENFQTHMKGMEVAPVECTLVTEEGKEINAILTTKLIHYGGETAILGIATDITGRKKMEEKIREYAMELEKKVLERTEALLRANELKSEFLANMSHEFRTPLNSILSFTEILLMELDGSVNEQQKEDLEMVKESGQDLLTLVNNLLDISKIEAGKVELHVGPVDPAEVIAVVASQFMVKTAEKGLQLTTYVSDVPFITADEAKVKQVLRNLVENGLKYTDEGEIRIGVFKKKGEVVFWVKDTGCGIAPEDQKIIFDKFKQARRGTKSGGTGLGLSVAKELVELHGGRIWVESDVGEGSTFSFSMPAV